MGLGKLDTGTAWSGCAQGGFRHHQDWWNGGKMNVGWEWWGQDELQRTKSQGQVCKSEIKIASGRSLRFRKGSLFRYLGSETTARDSKSQLSESAGVGRGSCLNRKRCLRGNNSDKSCPHRGSIDNAPIVLEFTFSEKRCLRQESMDTSDGAWKAIDF